MWDVVLHDDRLVLCDRVLCERLTPAANTDVHVSAAYDKTDRMLENASTKKQSYIHMKQTGNVNNMVYIPVVSSHTANCINWNVNVSCWFVGLF